MTDQTSKASKEKNGKDKTREESKANYENIFAVLRHHVWQQQQQSVDIGDSDESDEQTYDLSLYFYGYSDDEDDDKVPAVLKKEFGSLSFTEYKNDDQKVRLMMIYLAKIRKSALRLYDPKWTLTGKTEVDVEESDKRFRELLIQIRRLNIIESRFDEPYERGKKVKEITKYLNETLSVLHKCAHNQLEVNIELRKKLLSEEDKHLSVYENYYAKYPKSPNADKIGKKLIHHYNLQLCQYIVYALLEELQTNITRRQNEVYQPFDDPEAVFNVSTFHSLIRDSQDIINEYNELNDNFDRNLFTYMYAMAERDKRMRRNDEREEDWIRFDDYRINEMPNWAEEMEVEIELCDEAWKWDITRFRIFDSIIENRDLHESDADRRQTTDTAEDEPLISQQTSSEQNAESLVNEYDTIFVDLRYKVRKQQKKSSNIEDIDEFDGTALPSEVNYKNVIRDLRHHVRQQQQQFGITEPHLTDGQTGDLANHYNENSSDNEGDDDSGDDEDDDEVPAVLTQDFRSKSISQSGKAVILIVNVNEDDMILYLDRISKSSQRFAAREWTPTGITDKDVDKSERRFEQLLKQINRLNIIEWSFYKIDQKKVKLNVLTVVKSINQTLLELSKWVDKQIEANDVLRKGLLEEEDQHLAEYWDFYIANGETDVRVSAMGKDRIPRYTVQFRQYIVYALLRALRTNINYRQQNICQPFVDKPYETKFDWSKYRTRIIDSQYIIVEYQWLSDTLDASQYTYMYAMAEREKKKVRTDVREDDWEAFNEYRIEQMPVWASKWKTKIVLYGGFWWRDHTRFRIYDTLAENRELEPNRRVKYYRKIYKTARLTRDPTLGGRRESESDDRSSQANDETAGEKESTYKRLIRDRNTWATRGLIVSDANQLMAELNAIRGEAIRRVLRPTPARERFNRSVVTAAEFSALLERIKRLNELEWSYKEHYKDFLESKDVRRITETLQKTLRALLNWTDEQYRVSKTRRLILLREEEDFLFEYQELYSVWHKNGEKRGRLRRRLYAMGLNRIDVYELHYRQYVVYAMLMAVRNTLSDRLEEFYIPMVTKYTLPKAYPRFASFYRKLKALLLLSQYIPFDHELITNDDDFYACLYRYIYSMIKWESFRELPNRLTKAEWELFNEFRIKQIVEWAKRKEHELSRNVAKWLSDPTKFRVFLSLQEGKQDIGPITGPKQ